MRKWHQSHRIRRAFVQGSSFGLISGIITTLGLMVGLHSGTQSRLAVIGGIVTIAIADAFSDGFGMHVSQEAGDNDGIVDLWLAAGSVFVAKFFFALTFLVPLWLFELTMAVIVGVVWGFGLLGGVSYWIARRQQTPPWKAVAEHFLIGGLVVVINHFVGLLVAGLYLE